MLMSIWRASSGAVQPGLPDMKERTDTLLWFSFLLKRRDTKGNTISEEMRVKMDKDEIHDICIHRGSCQKLISLKPLESFCMAAFCSAVMLFGSTAVTTYPPWSAWAIGGVKSNNKMIGENKSIPKNMAALRRTREVAVSTYFPPILAI